MQARFAWVVVGSLVAACGAADPCDTLCEDAGFDGVDVAEDRCSCSSPAGLGGALSLSDCQDYCETVGAGADGAVLSTEETEDDTCVCGSAS